MHNHDYQDMPCISSHWLKDMLISPAYCYQRHLDPDRETQASSPAMILGSLVHCLTLNPLQLGQEFTIQNINRRTKEGKARYDALSKEGWLIVTPTQFEQAQAIVAALKSHPDARLLLTQGKKEKTFIQDRDCGLLPLKARLDVHHPEHRRVVELKTIHDLNKITTAMRHYHYALSAAFYVDIAQAQSIHFVFVESQEPYGIESFELPPQELQAGREQYQTTLSRFDDCWRAKNWPDAEPVSDAEEDDDLMMNFMPTPRSRQGHNLNVGELQL